MVASLAALAVVAALGGGASAVGETEPFLTGRLVEGVATVADPTQTYTLYLPSSYRSGARLPALLIFDPRGRATMAAELFREAAEEHGWILLSSNDTRSDGPMEPNVRAVNAMWPDVHERLSTDPRRIYATGFSGGAILAYTLALQTGEIAGVIGVGGRLEAHDRNRKVKFPHFGAVGNTDFNYSEMRRMDSLLDKWGAPRRLDVFVGPHRWMPPEIAGRALAWMEIQAMRSGLRPVDAALVSSLFDREVAHARSLELEGDLLAALRSRESTLEAFSGLHDESVLEALGAETRRLARSAQVKRAKKDEQNWDSFETRYFSDLAWLDAALGAAGRDEELSAGEIANRLDIRSLREKAAEGSYRGTVSQRILETLFTRFAFYRTRSLFAAGEFRNAASVLEVAIRIKPERADTWYNLACAQARSGSTRKALASLAKALDAGFSDLGLLESDTDLESLHGHDEYSRLVERLRGAD